MDASNRQSAKPSRVYIILRESIAKQDIGHAALSIAHAMMAAAHAWQEDANFQEWRILSFRKFLGIANEKEWAKLKALDKKHMVMTESGIDGNPEVSIIFEPMADDIPNVLKWIRPLNEKNLGYERQAQA